MKHVIVIIDDDAPLCELLAGLLRSEHRVVDTVDSVEGLTAELIALSQPSLVVLNPRTANLGLDEMKRLVRDVRALAGARFVLMLTEADAGQGQALATQLGAEGSVRIRTLLRDPLMGLVGQAAELGADEPPPPSHGVADLSADDILGLEFELEVPPDAGASYVPRPSQVVQQQQPVLHLTKLIDEELARPVERAAAHEFDVQLDVMSEHNLVSSARGEIIGVYVSSLFPPPIGSAAHLKVAFPWGETTEVKGTVAFSRAEDSFKKRRRPGVGVTVVPSEAFAVAAARFASLRRPMLELTGSDSGVTPRR